MVGRCFSRPRSKCLLARKSTNVMFELVPFIEAAGYIGIFAIIFAETGLLVGFFLPGDTLLFAAGILASKGYFNVAILLVIASVAAIVGDSVGYFIGKKLGPRIFKKEDSLFFKKEYVARAQVFFAKHGKKTIVLARYIPIVRTFAPVVAGVGAMPYKTFFAYNVAGGILWCFSMILAGYFLGARIPNIDAYILPVIIGIFVLSFVPVAREFFRHKRDAK
jgi:membrane-associated protein